MRSFITNIEGRACELDDNEDGKSGSGSVTAIESGEDSESEGRSSSGSSGSSESSESSTVKSSGESGSASESGEQSSTTTEGTGSSDSGSPAESSPQESTSGETNTRSVICGDGNLRTPELLSSSLTLLRTMRSTRRELSDLSGRLRRMSSRLRRRNLQGRGLAFFLEDTAFNEYRILRNLSCWLWNMWKRSLRRWHMWWGGDM